MPNQNKSGKTKTRTHADTHTASKALINKYIHMYKQTNMTIRFVAQRTICITKYISSIIFVTSTFGMARI
jgi:hypothetical protein